MKFVVQRISVPMDCMKLYGINATTKNFGSRETRETVSGSIPTITLRGNNFFLS